MAVSVYQQGGYGTAPLFPNPIIARRDPASTDKVSPSGQSYPIFQLWNNELTDNNFMYLGGGIWVSFASVVGSVSQLSGNTGVAVPTSGNINIVGANTLQVTGSGSTLTINPTVSGFPITPFVVGPSGKAGYQTIQSAINAANTAGGGIVYIQPGQYTENLTLFSGVDLYGTPAVSQNQGSSTTILGTHTPPTSGHVGFNSICFVSTTNVISSSASGTTHLVFVNCESAVQNGYFLNLLNWTGILEIFDNNSSTAGAPFAINDGGINNTGGATLFFFTGALGSGTNVMNLSGLIVCQDTDFGCPVNFQTGSIISIDEHIFLSPITFSGNSTGNINTCRFVGGSSAAITMSSSGAIKISESVIQSTNNPSIAGVGTGVLTLGGNTYLNNALKANTLTISYNSTEGILSTTNTPGASPQIVNARTGQVVFTDVIANGAFGTLTLTDSVISSTSIIIATASCSTVNSALQIAATTPGSGSVAFRIFNAGSASTAANILVNFWVIN